MALVPVNLWAEYKLTEGTEGCKEGCTERGNQEIDDIQQDLLIGLVDMPPEEVALR